MPKFSAPILDSNITLPSTGPMTPPPQVFPGCARSFSSENTTPCACRGVHCPVQKRSVQPQLSRRPLAAIQSSSPPSCIHVIDRPVSARNIPSLKLSIQGLFVGRQWRAYLISFLNCYREVIRIPYLLDSGILLKFCSVRKDFRTQRFLCSSAAIQVMFPGEEAHGLGGP
jgi:hypothetical protein